MAKEIFFHIGAHKSASTTIQHNLKSNRDYLMGCVGLVPILAADYPQSDFFRFFLDLSDGTINCEDSIVFDERLQRAKLSFEEIVSKVDPGKSVFFSYEGFLGYCRLHEYRFLYPHSRFVMKALRAITSGFSVKVVLVVRSQDAYIESCYLQQIKVGRVLDFSSYFDSLALDSFSWLRIADEASDAFGIDNVKILPFEMIRDVGVFEFIARIIVFLTGKCIDGVNFNLIDKSNESISKKGLQLCLAAYPLLEDLQDRKDFRAFVFKQFPVADFGRPNLISSEQAEIVMGICAESNVELFKKYIPGAPFYE